MNALFVAVRMAHYASVMLLFGELVYALLIANGFRDVLRHGVRSDESFRWSLALANLGLIVSIPPGIAWLCIEAASMSDTPLEDALDPSTLGPVLTGTLFGHVWLFRLALAFVLALLLLATYRSKDDRRRGRLAIVAALFGAVYTGTLAWAGHAAAGSTDELAVHLPADVIHLIAAAAWVGALPGLVLTLRRRERASSERSLKEEAEVARRFSAFGIGLVGLIVISGVINSVYLVGDIPALIGTDYGQILFAKLALVATMIAIAAFNRQSLVWRLDADDRMALRRLRTNAMLELVIGICVLALVGVLGITVPAAHEPSAWPFPFRFDFDAPTDSVGLGIALIGAAALAIGATFVVIRGILRGRPHLWISGLGTLAVALAISGVLLAVPASPATYLTSPVPYTTASIARGSSLYASECAACHGVHGRGERVAVKTVPRVDLLDALPRRPPGDIFWSIAFGNPGTLMRGFAPKVSDASIWDLIQYLRAELDAEKAMPMFGSVRPWRPIEAPDFTFETRGRAQETLQRLRGNTAILLVLYTLPQSLSRLEALASEQLAYAQKGVRVIAIPFAASAAIDTHEIDAGQSIFATVAVDVAKTYSMYARGRADVSSGGIDHVEFLIDRQGYLRARWIGIPSATSNQAEQILEQADLLKRERPRPPGQWKHAH